MEQIAKEAVLRVPLATIALTPRHSNLLLAAPAPTLQLQPLLALFALKITIVTNLPLLTGTKF